MKYLAVQNNVILDIFDTHEDALACIENEKRKDMASIIIKRKLRKLFLKDPSNIALHRYSIISCSSEEVIQ